MFGFRASITGRTAYRGVTFASLRICIGGRICRIKIGQNPPRRPFLKKGISKEGYFELERGRYGPVFPRTPACYGFSIIAKVKEGREETVRAYGKTIEEAIAASPEALAPLRLHYLRWVLFDVGSGLHFQYQGIFDTDFDKYTEDAVALFSATGITTVFTNLEGFPEDWKENPDAFIKFVREHQCSSFLEYGEYPYVTADEVKKALRLKAAFSTMLDQMQ